MPFQFPAFADIGRMAATPPVRFETEARERKADQPKAGRPTGGSVSQSGGSGPPQPNRPEERQAWAWPEDRPEELCSQWRSRRAPESGDAARGGKNWRRKPAVDAGSPGVWPGDPYRSTGEGADSARCPDPFLRKGGVEVELRYRALDREDVELHSVRAYVVTHALD